MRVGIKMNQSSRQAAKKIKRKKANRPHAVLDVVAEDPQRPHVSNDMEPAAVEEHAGKERPVVIQREPQLNRPFGMSITRRDNAEIIEELLQHRLGHGELEEKDHAVNYYYDPGAEGRVFRRNRVANRNN